MIDLHSHTDESDGTYTPAELVDAALRQGLGALAITDHDTFAGYDQVSLRARANGLDLVCGIELSTRLPGQREFAIHMLGYFLNEPPPVEFRSWLNELQAERRERNVRLIENLKSKGVEIELSEVEAVGRTLTGRPHFARVLVQKGYASDSEDAFRRYLGESSPCYVERHGPHAAMGAQRIIAGGGLPVLAHPVRLGVRNPEVEESVIRELRDAGLGGIEVYHSDHRPKDVERYAGLAKKLDFLMSLPEPPGEVVIAEGGNEKESGDAFRRFDYTLLPEEYPCAIRLVDLNSETRWETCPIVRADGSDYLVHIPRTVLEELRKRTIA